MIKVDRTIAPCPTVLKPDSEAKKKELCAAKEHYTTHPPKTGSFRFALYKHESVKSSLSRLFHGKCAYCESNYEGNHPVDIEHYRPKSEVVLGKGKRITGYWWLAAEWQNLLPSCIDCNRERSQYFSDGKKADLAGKGSQFPILEPSFRATKPNEEINETPLLLNPCDHNPSEYLSFADREGFNIAINVGGGFMSSKIARTSIRILGLNRQGLVNSRTAHIRHLQFQLDSLVDFILILDESPKDAIKDIASNRIAEILGYLSKSQRSSSEFSAASRALITPVMNDLKDKIEEHKLRSSPGRV
jgi:uncharacterized protein (TIGR02646 family)